MGKLSRPSFLAIVGLVFMVILVRRRSPFALLRGIALVTLLGSALGLVHVPAALVSAPDFGSVFLELDVLGALKPALSAEGLGEEFLEEVEPTISRICDMPAAWPKLSERVWRCQTRRFPYGILYREALGRIEIVAVMHLRRHPDTWKSR